MKIIVTDEQQLSEIIRQAIAAEFDARQLVSNSGTDAPTTRRALSIDEFCHFTGFSRQYTYRLTSAGKIPFSKQGGKVWFDRSEVETWLLSNRRATTGEAAQQATDYLQSAARRNR